MSLELALQQNTAAINALVEILSKGVIPTPAAADAQPAAEEPATEKAVTKKAMAEKIKAKMTEVSKAEEPKEETKVEEQLAEEPVKEAVEAKLPTYTETAALVTKVTNTKGRAVAVELLAKFGVKTLNEVKASSYAKVIEACEAVLG